MSGLNELTIAAARDARGSSMRSAKRRHSNR